MFNELQENLIKPYVFKFIQQHNREGDVYQDVQFIYDTILGIMTKSLNEIINQHTTINFDRLMQGNISHAIGIHDNDDNNINMYTPIQLRLNKQERDKQIQLAHDYLLIDNPQESEKYFENAFKLIKHPMNKRTNQSEIIESEWLIISDSIESFLKQNKFNQCKNRLLNYFCNNSSHIECLKWLCALTLNCDLDDCRTFVYTFATLIEDESTNEKNDISNDIQIVTQTENQDPNEKENENENGDTGNSNANDDKNSKEQDTKDTIKCDTPQQTEDFENLLTNENTVLSYFFKIVYFQTIDKNLQRSDIAWKKLMAFIENKKQQDTFATRLLSVCDQFLQKHMLCLAEVCLQLYTRYIDNDKTNSNQNDNQEKKHQYNIEYFLKMARLSILKLSVEIDTFQK